MPLPRVAPLRLLAGALCLLVACGDAPSAARGAGPPARLVVVAGNGQQGSVAMPLRDSLVVQVVDAQGNPTPVDVVRWTVADGDGAVTAASTPVDAAATAWTRWTLGTTARTQTVTATVGDLAPARFTAQGQPGPVQTVTVAGVTGKVAPGAVRTLVAQASDAHGNPVSGRPVAWASSQPAVAAVGADGQLTALAEGTATVSATVEGRTAALEVTVTPWPNEPVGMAVVSDYGFDRLDGAWQYLPVDGTARIVQDPTAPRLPRTAVEFVYPRGFTGGGYSPATMQAPAPFPDGAGRRNVRELYWGFVWKANAEWQNHESNINKLGYGWLNNTATFGLTWHWGSVTIGGRRVSKMVSLFEGGRYYHFNTPAAFNLEPGRWYQVEVQFRPSSAPGRADGIVRIWVDDVLCADHVGVTTTSGYISNVYFSPTWGGNGVTPKGRDDYIRVNRVRISTR